MDKYMENEMVTISLERYDELKEAERLLEQLRQCLDIVPSSNNAIDFNRTWSIRLDTAKEQLNEIASLLGYKMSEKQEA